MLFLKEFNSMTCVIYIWREKPTKKKRLLSTSITTILTLLLLAPIGSAIVDNAVNVAITDLSGTTYAFTSAQLLAMPKTEVVADLYCDGALVTYGNWSGVTLSYLLNQTHLTPEVWSIQFTASDGYGVAIPIDLAIEPQIIIAYELNGQPLAEGLRLIIPDANGASWIANIISITMSTSGAAYPQAISVGHITQNNAPTPESTLQPSPIQQEASIQPQMSTPENSSSSIQETNPTNVTQPSQSVINSQASNQILNMQSTVYLILVVCAISFTVAAFIVFRCKRKQTLKADVGKHP